MHILPQIEKERIVELFKKLTIRPLLVRRVKGMIDDCETPIQGVWIVQNTQSNAGTLSLPSAGNGI